MQKKKKAPTKNSVDIFAADMRDVEAYTHDDKKRTNNPPAGKAQLDTTPETRKTYAYDPNIDPALQWAGKAERDAFEVPTSSIHIHESIKPHSIIDAVRNLHKGSGAISQQEMFDDSPEERMRKRNAAIEFYQHGVDWTNRLIAGDSLIVMNSLIEKEGMAGQVQMVYIDPPYGIKYGSNFQPFVNKRDVKDKDDKDLNREPEVVTAFRDTWELGIHSYLTYLRDRLKLAKELLTESGSVFVQIGDENVHLARIICDEIFGADNFISFITVRKTLPLGSKGLAGVCDYLVWYAKDKTNYKYHQLFLSKQSEEDEAYSFLMFPDNTFRKITKEERFDPKQIPNDAKLFRTNHLMSAGQTVTCFYEFELEGKTIKPKHRSWLTNKEGMINLIEKGRVRLFGNEPQYILYMEDFPVKPIHNLWGNLQGATNPIYVVQTNTEVVKRCILMTTDPSDLVLDITCGSGTTAYVAEQWGRRWITCDTSRVAITLAKKRLMTATYDYYKLAHPEENVSGGFVYKTVPHVTLKSIANNEPPDTETLYDQPVIDKSKIRISGPFTVEALPAPIGAENVLPLSAARGVDYSAKLTDWRDELKATGIRGIRGEKIEFSRVEPLSGTVHLQANAMTEEEVPRRAVVCFAGETVPMDGRMAQLAIDEAMNLLPRPKMVVFAAFQFDPEASKIIGGMNWEGGELVMAQMNADLMTEDLKKKRSSNQSFWRIGQPDAEAVEIKDGEDAGKYRVRVKGFDYYNVVDGKVEDGDAGNIAMWSLDTNYDGLVFKPVQVFFPGGGWDKLAKTLRAEINQNLIEAYSGTESLPFEVNKSGANIAVKVIDDRGIESMTIIRVGARS